MDIFSVGTLGQTYFIFKPENFYRNIIFEIIFIKTYYFQGSGYLKKKTTHTNKQNQKP